MKRILSCLAATAGIALLISSTMAPSADPQGRARRVILRDGPYKVVMSKPITSTSWKAGSMYTEHENLTMMMNQLAIDGLKPVFSNIITEGAQGATPQNRMVFVCEKL